MSTSSRIREASRLARQFTITKGRRFRLSDVDPDDTGGIDSKEHAAALLAEGVARLQGLQEKLYAQGQWAVLLIFQAMDAAGKDSIIKHVMSGVNPQGCQVFSFKAPSSEDLAHDFLWRTTRCLPERGRIGIFNRSYYEEVLVVRVHPEFLDAEKVPETQGGGEKFWRARFRSIVDMERHLHGSGTRVVKFFLHVSPQEQRKRFLERIDDPAKNWKFGPDDMRERGFWKDYMRAYEACLGATSTKESPWYVVPADDKKTAQLIISRTILDAIDALKMRYPKPDAQRRQELREIRRQLMAEAGRS
jgi:PPK2 family polyphosphate:nucleotide phosphotransferase